MLDIIMAQVTLTRIQKVNIWSMIISQVIVKKNQHTIMNNFLVYPQEKYFQKGNTKVWVFSLDFLIPNPSPVIYSSMVAIGVTVLLIIVGLTHFKKWFFLWSGWLTTVDHKRIGIMYLISALLMLFRGGVDAVMMRAQLAVPDNKLLDSQHYNQIFSTHGVVMILFMAMPYIMALMNFVVPLQIKTQDLAFPRLNAISFWLFFMDGMLFNISFIIGGSPDAGWTSYFPLAGNEFSPACWNELLYDWLFR